MVEPRINVAIEWLHLNRLTAAMLLSAVIHLAAYAGLQAAKRLVVTWPPTPTPVPVLAEQKISMTFITVDPATAQTTAPKNPKYYSTQNTIAAQPEPAKTKATQPKVEGTKSEVPKIVDVPKPTPPTPKPTSLAANPAPKNTPKTTPLPLQPKPLQPAVAPPSPKPRTLAEAKNQQNSPGIFANKSQQEGATPRVGRLAFDAAGTPFGLYDAKFIAAVQERWYALLQNRNSAPGRVIIDFRLHDDGRVTDLRVAESSVDGLFSYFCERAILLPAPYERWPKPMRETIGASHRDVRFTFHYN